MHSGAPQETKLGVQQRHDLRIRGHFSILLELDGKLVVVLFPLLLVLTRISVKVSILGLTDLLHLEKFIQQPGLVQIGHLRISSSSVPLN